MKLICSTNIGSVSVAADGGALARRDTSVALAQHILAVTDAFDQSLAIEAAVDLKALVSSVEKSRVELKAPVLELGKRIDSVAREFCKPVEAELTRLNKLLTDYQVDQRKKAEEFERQRQAELARIAREKAESERKQAEAERVQREAEEKAKAAAARAFDDAETLAAAQAARDASAARQQAEAVAMAAREQSAKLVAEQVALKPLPPVAQAENMTVRNVWRWEVLDLVALYSARPDLVLLQAKTREINAAVANGAHALPGLRIWQEIETKVRA